MKKLTVVPLASFWTAGAACLAWLCSSFLAAVPVGSPVLPPAPAALPLAAKSAPVAPPVLPPALPLTYCIGAFLAVLPAVLPPAQPLVGPAVLPLAPAVVPVSIFCLSKGAVGPVNE